MSTPVEAHELTQIKQGDSVFLKALYKKYRATFIKWAERMYPGYVEDIPDIYQQAFTILYFNVKNDKFAGIDSTIQTYLFGIGKNLLNKKAGSKHEQTEALDSIKEIIVPAENVFEKYEVSHRQQMVQSILANVGEPCKTILTKYYFDNFTMEAIADTLGYKTAMVAKKKKCECLIRIRKALKEKHISFSQKKG